MMKFMFFSLSLVLLVKSWDLFQLSLWTLAAISLLVQAHELDWFCLGSMVSVDSMSMVLVSLTVWLMALVVKSSVKVKLTKAYSTYFLFCLFFLMESLIFAFSLVDFMAFYISFEISLLPILILILGWGYQPERIQAGVYMLFYTLFGSMPLLVSLLYLYNINGGVSFFSTDIGGSSFFLTMGLILAFAIKLPMFFFHLWLPKAHVEAPVSGSMILAGVLLKLGGYGLIRVGSLMDGGLTSVGEMFVSLNLIGAVSIGLICLNQVDLKALIAYSSVSHMAIVFIGILTYTVYGIEGALVIMVGHGLCSSGLFCIANMAYERLSSRSLLVSKGLLSLLPGLCVWWFLLSVGNMSAPPSLNLLGEVSVVISLVNWSWVTAPVVGLILFITGAYSLYLYSSSQHGKFSGSLLSFWGTEVNEYFILMLHWLPLNILIMKSEVMMF